MERTHRLKLPFSGDKLRDLRERRGWTQQALADRCTELGTPVSKFQVFRAEGKFRPRPATLVVFALALGVEIDDLLDAEEAETVRRSA